MYFSSRFRLCLFAFLCVLSSLNSFSGTYSVVWYGSTTVTGVGSGWTSSDVHVYSYGTNELDALTRLYGGASAENWLSTSQVNPLSGNTGWACPQFCWTVGSPSWISNGHNYGFLGWVVKVSGKKGTYVQNIGGSSQPISYYAGKPLFICSCCNRGYMLGGWDPIPYHLAIVNDAVVPPYLFQNPGILSIGSIGGGSSGTIDSIDANTVSPAGDNLILNDGTSTNDLYSEGNSSSYSNSVSATSASDLSSAFYAKFHPDFATIGNAVLLGNNKVGDIAGTLLTMQGISSVGNSLLTTANTYGNTEVYNLQYINSKMDTVNGNIGTANSWLSQIKTLNSSILSQLQTGSGSSGGSVDLSGVRSDIQANTSTLKASIESAVSADLDEQDLSDGDMSDLDTLKSAADAHSQQSKDLCDAAGNFVNKVQQSRSFTLSKIQTFFGGMVGSWAGLGRVPIDSADWGFDFEGCHIPIKLDLGDPRLKLLIDKTRAIEVVMLWVFFATRVMSLFSASVKVGKGES